MTGLPESLEYVLYVGDDLLPRRMEIEVPGMGTLDGGNGQMGRGCGDRGSGGRSDLRRSPC